MAKLHKCIKEWNVTVEALGQGLQTFLIRKYEPPYKEFFLFPTSSYSLRKDFTSDFKGDFKSFVENNAVPVADKSKIEIKFYAKCDEIITAPLQNLELISDFFIWNQDHVETYLDKKDPIIWLLRVYELDNPYFIKFSVGGIRYANLRSDLSIDNSKPILSDKDFLKQKRAIKNKLNL